MKKKETLCWTPFLASGLLFASFVSATESEHAGIVNIVSGSGSSTAIAVGAGSRAVVDGISVDGQTVSAGKVIQDTGIKKTEQRDLDPYHSVEIDSFPEKTVLHFSHRNSAVVTADQAVVPVIRTTVKNDTLFIGLKESVSTGTPPQLHLNAETISSLKIKGFADVTIEDVAADRLRLEINGSGTVSAKGKVHELELILSGSGTFETGGLVAEQCTVRIDGAGDAAVHVTGILHAEINGAGDIAYFGKPSKIIKNINGAGDIEPAGH